jgi:cytochrome c oxidase cbb3-type subunit 3
MTMTFNWTLFVAILTIANILACFWLLWWTRKRRDDGGSKESATSTTGHVWDGDLVEYNKPLPKWWLNLFYATIVFALGYLVFYPGLGGYAGTSGWSSNAQHDAEVAAAEAKIAPLFARFASVPLDQLAQDADAVALGRSVYANNCAQCHGADARGAKGFPNLTDADWLWGGTADAVLATIVHGRNAVMPPWGAALGDQGVAEVTAYVQSLSGVQADPALAGAGQAKFTMFCASCHGTEGKGNVALGAPNLTDDVWLYGKDPATIADTIRNGRNGVMPAWGPIIGNDRARLAAAFVLSQAPRGVDGSAVPAATQSSAIASDDGTSAPSTSGNASTGHSAGSP